MVSLEQYKKLQYEYEVLWARYDIRNHYLDEIVQEVYQNIGQVLSLIRVQLSLLSINHKSAPKSATESGHLVGKVIQDLKGMCRSFHPETEFLAKLGIIQTLEHELKLLDSDHVEPVIEVKGNPCSLPIGTELITFRMLQEILFCIAKEHKRRPIYVRILYEKNDVTFMIKYAGKPIEWKQFNLHEDNTSSLTRLPLLQRAELIDAKLQVKYGKAHQTCIRLIVPFKTSLYE